MTESPTEALTRAVAPLLEKIRESDLLPAEMLPVGCIVKLGGGQDWVAFDGFYDGLMHLSTGSSGFVYEPVESERFVWHRAPF